MTDTTIDTLVAGADPCAGVLPQDALTPGETALRDAITADPPASAVDRRVPRRRLLRRALAVGLVGATALGIGAVIGIDRVGDGASPAWSAQAVDLAERSPRLLLDDGWTVTRVDESDTRQGEMTFTRGRLTYELHWRAASLHQGYLDDRADPGSTERVGTVSVLGHEATVFRYRRSQDFTALWLQDGHSLEMRGVTPGGAQGFRDLLGRLRAVDVDTWLGAMPPSSVRPSARAAAVDAMLEGIPVPPGLDVGALRSADLVVDGYQLGAHVSGTVACAWIGRWVDARAAGDTAAARAATAAMATSHRWPVLRGMQAEGDYPAVLWELADAMATDADVPAGKPGIGVADSYREALGCDAP